MRAELTITTAAAIEAAAVDAVGTSFDAFYRDRYLPMVRLATLLVDRVDVAEEIVQEAFAAAYLRWRRLDAPAGYVRAAVVNRSRDALRWRRRRRTVALSEPVVDPDEPVDHVRAAIAALPRAQRTAVVLRFYEDLTVDAIADAMGTRPGTVKSLLHRGIAALREEIRE
jgi:RNA polymerase sigma-70 factor (sigma-E family)